MILMVVKKENGIIDCFYGSLKKGSQKKNSNN